MAKNGGGAPLIASVIHSDNPLIKYGVSTLIVFGVLYFLTTLGVPGTTLVAVIIALGFAIYVAQNKLTFRI